MRGWLLAAAVLLGGADATPDLALPLEQQVIVSIGGPVHDATIAVRCGLRSPAVGQRILEASLRRGVRIISDEAIATGISGNGNAAVAFAKAAVLAAEHAASREFAYYGQVACRKLRYAGALRELDEMIQSMDAGMAR